MKLLFLALLYTASALAGDDPVHERSSPPPGARYEIVQSPMLAGLTFRLDRFFGHIAQLVTDKDGGLGWESTPVRGLRALDGNPATARPRFQIFMSGQLARHTLLVDVVSGQSWIFTSITDQDGKQIGRRWEPLAEFPGQPALETEKR